MPTPTNLVTSAIYRFGAFTLNLESREIYLGTQYCHMEPRAFDLLAYLVAHRDRVVRKEELFAVVWGGTHVCEGALSQCVSILRRTLGDSGRHQRLIRTYPRIGYRFVGPVIEAGSSAVHGLLPQMGPFLPASNADFY